MLKHSLPLAILTLAAATQSLAAPPSGPVSAVRKFMAATGSGDGKAVAAFCASDAVVVDEFAPHMWTGADACARWYQAFGGWMKAEHIDQETVELGKVLVDETTGDAAYVVANAVENNTMDGKPMTESARMAFALRKESGMWRLTAVTWAGAKPQHGASSGAQGPAGPGTPATPSPAMMGRMY
ncbi:MAG TPA: nuclear transport factor 2 family protein [Caulobacteraceae bacterium]|jgi:ketosteroid isomerase-like protein|nr:nuclear transport factor 2 family protein [Caulobacteraceae bacterium]